MGFLFRLFELLIVIAPLVGVVLYFLRAKARSDARRPSPVIRDEAGMTRQQPMVAIECIQCGAGDRVPADQAGYACAACGSRMVFRRCSRCHKVVQLDALNTSNNRACSYCAAPITGGWVNASAQDQEQQLVHSGHPPVPDPDLRVIRGVVVVASAIPGITPGSSCSVRFRSDRTEIIPLTRDGFGNAVTIEYANVDRLEISGPGAKTTTTDAGLIGGGFGVKGAVEGIAAASVINALTRKTTTTIDTVVDLKAGRSELLLRTHTFEPATLHALLSPVYYRIQRATRN